MLNFAINRKKSKEFIRFYKEKDNSIIVCYGDHFRESFPSCDRNKEILNAIMEEQVINGENYFTDESSKLRIDSRKHLGRLFFVYSFFTASFGILTIPIADFFSLNNVVGNYAFGLTGGLLILPINNMFKAVDLVKHRLFLENKECINQYLEENDNKVLNINDIHNLNIFNVAVTSIKANQYNKKYVLKKDLCDKKIKDKKVKQKRLSF